MNLDNPSLARWVAVFHDDFAEIERELGLGEGFILSPVELPGPDVGRALGAWLAGRGHAVHVLAPDGEAWRPLAAELLGLATEPGSIVLVVGNWQRTPELAEGLRLLNHLRDSVVQKLGCPLLWCGPPEFLHATWELAPDFWSIRGLTYRFAAAPGGQMGLWGIPLGTSGRLESPERLRELRATAQAQGDRRNAMRFGAHLAGTLMMRGELGEVEQLGAEVLGEARALGESRAEAETLLMLGRVLGLRGCFDEASALLGQAEALAERSRYPDLALGSREAAAWLLHFKGDHAQARQTFERCIAQRTAHHGTEFHPRVLHLLRELAGVMKAQGDFAAARTQLERCLTLQRQLYGKEVHPEVAETLQALAGVLQESGDLPGARAQLERCLSILQQIYGTEERLEVIQAMGDLGAVRHAQGESAPARELLERALRAAEKLLGTRDTWLVAAIEIKLADTLDALGEEARAHDLEEHARRVIDHQLGPDHPLLRELRSSSAED